MFTHSYLVKLMAEDGTHGPVVASLLGSKRTRARHETEPHDWVTGRRTYGLPGASVNPQLNHILAQQRSAELQRDGEQARFSRELSSVTSRTARVLKHRQDLCGAGFTLHGHHIAKLDRFVGQAQRAASRAEREFEGVSIEVDSHGVVTVHASGVMSMVL